MRPPAPSTRTTWLWLIIGLAPVMALGIRTLSSSAIFRHMATGRHILEHGLPRVDPFSFGLPPDTPWINPSWLYDIGVFVVGQLGIPALTLIHLAFVVFGLIGASRAVSLPTPPWTMAALPLIASWLLAPVFTPSPELFGMFMCGLFLLTLSRITWPISLPQIAALFFLQWIWANTHASFFLGPILLMLRGWELLRPSLPTRAAMIRAGALFLAAMVVTLLNPYGFDLHRYLFELALDDSRRILLEWISPFSGEFPPHLTRHASTLLLVMLATPFIVWPERLPLTSSMPGIASALILVSAAPFPAIATVLALPLLAYSLVAVHRLVVSGMNRFPRLGLPHPLPWITSGFVLLTLALTLSNAYYVQTGHASSFGLGQHPEIYPSPETLQQLNRLGEERVLVHTSFDGDYLLWAQPGILRFTDSRADLFGKKFYDQLQDALLGQTGGSVWLDEQWDPDAILLNASWPHTGTAIQRLQQSGQWIIISFDGISAVLLRATSTNQELLGDPDNVVDHPLIEAARLHHLRRLDRRFLRAPIPVRVFGAAGVVHALGDYEHSLDLHHLLVRGAPRMEGGWFRLGIAAVQTGHNDVGLACLKRCAQWKPGNPLPWLWMARAHEQAGRTEAAEAYYQKSAAMNHRLTQVFRAGESLPVSGTLPEGYRETVTP